MGDLSPFPSGYLGVELFINGTWTDVTADLSEDGVSITRGRADESSQIEPARMTCSLKNTAGKYSPRNPSSPYYGLIGRNTPVRAYVKLGQTRLLQEPLTYISTPDNAALDITGDLDLRVDLDPPSWRPSVLSYIGLLKDTAYGLFISTDGKLNIQWWTDAVTTLVMTSTVPIPGGAVGRRAVRATLDVNNGAAGRTATFYYADTISGTWVQFGDPVTTSGITSVFNSTGQLRSLVTTEMGTTQIYALEVRNGINGTVVANPIFEGQPEGTTSFTDGAGRVWTAGGSPTVTNRNYRFWGEVTTWPQRWTKKGSPSVYTPIECSGVMRRLNQGSSPIRSAMFRGCSTLGANLIGYWPMEDLTGSRFVAAGITGINSAKVIGAPKYRIYDGFIASDAVLTVGTSKIIATSKSHTATGAAQVRFSGNIPASTPNNAVLLRLSFSGGTIANIEVVYTTGSGGNLTAKAYDSDGVLLNTGNVLNTVADGLDARYSVEVSTVGSDVKVSLVVVLEGDTSGFFVDSTFVGRTFGRITSVDINPAQAALTDFAIGHLTVEKAITSVFTLANQFNAWVGEKADDRIQRLASENATTLFILGAGGDSQGMGEQKIDSLLDLFREVAASDSGLLYEPRTSDDLEYRTLETMYSQTPGITIAYTDNLLIPFEPVDDDQFTRNRVTVTRDGGSSSTEELTSGTLSTQAPPNGVGIYDDSVTLSLDSDGSAADQAGWRVHLGTVDEARWPTIGLDLAHPTFLNNLTRTSQILTLDLGDRLDVTNVPSWLPPFPVSQLIQGYSEIIQPLHYRIEFNCTPARPYRVPSYGVSSDRYSDPGSVISADPGTSGTSLTVTPSGGVLWTIADGSFDIVINGERMTVTNITGTGPTQTFTVTRSVNGVVKSHAINSAVFLYDPVYYGL